MEKSKHVPLTTDQFSETFVDADHFPFSITHGIIKKFLKYKIFFKWSSCYNMATPVKFLML